jgi:hypothetical protein
MSEILKEKAIQFILDEVRRILTSPDSVIKAHVENMAASHQVLQRKADALAEALRKLKHCAHACSDGNCPHDRKYRDALAALKAHNEGE